MIRRCLRFSWRLLLSASVCSAAMLLIYSTTTGQQAKSDEGDARTPLAIHGFERRGGLVNFVSGEGRCLCVAQPNAQSKQPLTDGDSVELGNGRAELILIPGYYLRLSDHTTVRLLDVSRDNLKIEITKGSAIVEIPMEDAVPPLAPEYQELKERFFNVVTVITPGGEYAIFKAGGYRFDVTANRESRVRVMKGAVAAGGHIVKEGSASMMAGAVSLVAGDKYVEDEFDKWSRERAATLVQANKSLKQTEWYKQMDHGDGYIDVLDDKQAGGASPHVVSARYGVAGFVETGVSIKSAEGDWRELKSDAQLADGDRVRSAPSARAEIRPYPDFDLYLSGDSEVTYRVNADEMISIDLTKGSAALFISETRVKRAERNSLTVSANHSEYTIKSAGYYRLNVFSSSESELLVYSGSVTANGEIGSGKRMVVRGESRVTSSLDKESRDSFDIWSDRRNARTQFTPRKGWFAGLWFLNPETSEYTFVPGGRVCKSPYGGSYSTSYVLGRASLRPRPGSNSPTMLPDPRIIKVP